MRRQPRHLRPMRWFGLPARLVQVDHRHRPIAQTIPRARLRHYRHRCAVLQHVRQTIPRIRRVQRHVAPARLQDPQHADHHRQPALHAQPHPRIRDHTPRDQPMRQAVCQAVQLPVAQLRCAVLHRDRLRRAGRLGLHQAGQRRCARVRRLRPVPSIDLLMAFRFGQHSQAAQRFAPAALKGRDQTGERGLQIPDDPLGIHARHALHDEPEVFSEIVHDGCQRIVGALVHAQDIDARPCRGHLAGGFGLRHVLAIVQQRAEQGLRRRHAATALGLGQRRILVAHQRGQPDVRVPGAGGHHPVVQQHAQRQRIDEHAHRVLGTATALRTAHQHRTEHHVVAAARRAHDPGPGQVMQAGRTHLQQPCLLPQPAAEGAAQPACRLPDGEVISASILQAEREGRLHHIGQHLAEKRFVRVAGDGLPGARHVVSEGDCAGQVPSLVRQTGFELGVQPFHRGGIVDHVVEHQHGDPAPPGRVFREDQPHQRRLPKVEAVESLVEALLQLRCDVAVGSIEPQLLAFQRGLPPDHLHRLVQAVPDHGRSQDGVPRDQALQTLRERLQARAAVHAEHGEKQVRIALLCHQMVVEDAFLQRCQRIDILDVGCAAGHLGRHAVDRRLAQRCQRQHRRRNPGAARCDAVRRNVDCVGDGDRCGKAGQGRLQKQTADVRAPSGLFDQGHEAHGL